MNNNFIGRNIEVEEFFEVLSESGVFTLITGKGVVKVRWLTCSLSTSSV